MEKLSADEVSCPSERDGAFAGGVDEVDEVDWPGVALVGTFVGEVVKQPFAQVGCQASVIERDAVILLGYLLPLGGCLRSHDLHVALLYERPSLFDECIAHDAVDLDAVDGLGIQDIVEYGSKERGHDMSVEMWIRAVVRQSFVD